MSGTEYYPSTEENHFLKSYDSIDAEEYVKDNPGSHPEENIARAREMAEAENSPRSIAAEYRSKAIEALNNPNLVYVSENNIYKANTKYPSLIPDTLNKITGAAVANKFLDYAEEFDKLATQRGIEAGEEYDEKVACEEALARIARQRQNTGHESDNS